MDPDDSANLLQNCDLEDVGELISNLLVQQPSKIVRLFDAGVCQSTRLAALSPGRTNGVERVSQILTLERTLNRDWEVRGERPCLLSAPGCNRGSNYRCMLRPTTKFGPLRRDAGTGRLKARRILDLTCLPSKIKDPFKSGSSAIRCRLTEALFDIKYFLATDQLYLLSRWQEKLYQTGGSSREYCCIHKKATWRPSWLQATQTYFRKRTT